MNTLEGPKEPRRGSFGHGRVARWAPACGVALVALVWSRAAAADVPDTVVMRGRTQHVRVYGARGGDPVVVSSGDGGWIHLAPQVASLLASRGFYVVGFDTRAYLEGFTSAGTPVALDQEPEDYRVLVDYAARGSARKPILVGVSEGAGLSVLAAASPRIKPAIGGVIGLGLPDLNELGWRWRDALIYLTHGVPNEPTFSTRAVAPKLSPLPLAAIHATRDEYVPLSEVERVIDAAREPRRLWVVRACDHRFSDNPTDLDRSLLDAMAWVRRTAS